MRLIVFDIDGTLIDSHAFITATMTAAFVAEGLEPPTPAMGRTVIGLSLPEALGRLSGTKGPVLDALVARYRSLYHGSVADGATHEALYPGAREAVLDARRASGNGSGHCDRQGAAGRSARAEAARLH